MKYFIPDYSYSNSRLPLTIDFYKTRKILNSLPLLINGAVFIELLSALFGGFRVDEHAVSVDAAHEFTDLKI